MQTEALFTERLILRRFCPEDALQLHENCSSDAETARYLERGASADPEITKALVACWAGLYETEDFFLWAIEYEGQVIGSVNLHDVSRADGSCEIGFSIGSKWWNRQIMTEAAGMVVRHAFERLEIKRIAGWCAAENMGSARVMEKIGMRIEGRTRGSVRLSDGRWADQIWYSIRREDKERI